MENKRGIPYDLKEITSQLIKEFPTITGLYLFGSRAQRTRSPRSDVDILVTTSEHILPSELRNFSELKCPPLDLFLVTGNKAQSCMNDSYILQRDFPALIKKLEAIQFWSKEESFLDVDIDWKFAIPIGVAFTYTNLNRSEAMPFNNWPPALQMYFDFLEKEGLPTRPYLGGDIQEISGFLIKLLRNFVIYTQQIKRKGQGLSFSFRTELDYQDLFFIIMKPWLPTMTKNPFTIRFDDQNKSADFGLFKNQIIIEMKHIKDKNTKAAVVKTLDGLTSFYRDNPTIKVLIFVIFVNHDIEVDAAEWEEKFSIKHNEQKVFTVVVSAPVISKAKSVDTYK